MHRCVAALLLAACSSSAVAAEAPTVDTLKQVLEKRLLSLTPTGFSERQVLFQEVRAGAVTGSTYPFQVTALIRDYGPGYPPNRYYGQTCVSRMDRYVFQLSPDAFGDWQVSGRMTVTDTYECRDNPAEGVSAMPLAGLAGAPAPAGSPPPAAVGAAPAADAGAVAAGDYECWHFGSPRLGLNFTIVGPGQYRDADGSPGTFSLSGGQVAFAGGALDGERAVYHAPGGRPTVSFRRRDAEVAYCEKAG